MKNNQIQDFLNQTISMETNLLFVILSVPVIFLSRQSIFRINTHGFYRFFNWECILWLFASNVRFWFVNPFSLNQLFSWFFFGSRYLFGYCGCDSTSKSKKTGFGPE